MVDLSADGMAESWHLDRKVPIAIILTLAGSIGSGIWWTSAQASRIASLEKSDALTSVRMDEAATTRTIMRERLARIEQLSVDNQDMLKRILDRMK